MYVAWSEKATGLKLFDLAICKTAIQITFYKTCLIVSFHKGYVASRFCKKNVVS